jgi:hypothetical protein
MFCSFYLDYTIYITVFLVFKTLPSCRYTIKLFKRVQQFEKYKPPFR